MRLPGFFGGIFTGKTRNTAKKETKTNPVSETRPESWPLPNPYGLIPAFEINGVQYFQFADLSDMPPPRYFVMTGSFIEHGMRCDRDFLDIHVGAIEDALSALPKKQTGDMVKILEHRLALVRAQTEILKSKLDYAVEPLLLYRLASCLYLTKDEDP